MGYRDDYDQAVIDAAARALTVSTEIVKTADALQVQLVRSVGTGDGHVGGPAQEQAMVNAWNLIVDLRRAVNEVHVAWKQLNSARSSWSIVNYATPAYVDEIKLNEERNRS